MTFTLECFETGKWCYFILSSFIEPNIAFLVCTWSTINVFQIFYPTWFSHAIFFSATWVKLRINGQFSEVWEKPSHFWSYLFNRFDFYFLTNWSRRNKCQALPYKEQLSNYEYFKLFQHYWLLLSSTWGCSPCIWLYLRHVASQGSIDLLSPPL